LQKVAALPKAVGWVVAEQPALRGYTVEWDEPGDFILSRRDRLYHSPELQPPFRLLGTFPTAPWKPAAAIFRPIQRLLRYMFYNVIKLSDGSLFVTFDRTAGILRNGRFELLPIERPCRILRGGCALDEKGDLFFGEYVYNTGRNLIRIYKYRSTTHHLDVVHEFPAGSIRHVHGIYYDSFASALWCCTGDFGNECRIMRTKDEFRTIETVGGGDETWRCVSLLFNSSGVYYGTDAEFRRNYLYRFDGQTAERTVLTEVGGPVYYSRAAGNDLFFGVTAELCPSQTDRSATLWHVGPDNTAARTACFEKDALPLRFQFGLLHFPAGAGLPGRLFFHGLALKGADNKTFQVRRAPK
jgi:hypothetical protein